MFFDLIDYLLGILKLFIYKIVYFNKFKISSIGKFSFLTQIRIFGKKAKLQIGKNFTIRSGVKVRVYNGSLVIGDHVGFNNNCCLNCLSKITIGDNVIIGQSVMFYDHDHDYKSSDIN